MNLDFTSIIIFNLALAGLYILSKVYKFFIRSGVDVRKYGSWAVVTGASDGIGKAYSFELAKRGLNVVLISRTESKLQAVASEINAKYPKVETKVVPVDFGNFDAAAQARVKAAVEPLELALLVNNVGQSYAYPQFLKEFKEENYEQLANLNITSTVVMTRIVLPQMEARKKGLIVNMSSGSSAMGGSPLLTQYAASKQYVNEFSSSLHYEYAGGKMDIRVQAQVPLYVASKLSKMRPSFSTPTPAAFARMSLNMVGHETVVSPFWVHAVMLWVMNRVPIGLRLGYVAKMHAGIRKRALKKIERQAAGQ
jgi:17beta-estradiol 17-dehydrogenase / very-long-chain 3-oxoacyl-CoA reductase